MEVANFWWFLTLACLVWYSTITVYVSIRGIRDIKGMFGRLQAMHDAEADESDAAPDK